MWVLFSPLAAQSTDSSVVMFILRQVAEQFFLSLVGLQFWAVLLMTVVLILTLLLGLLYALRHWIRSIL